MVRVPGRGLPPLLVGLVLLQLACSATFITWFTLTFGFGRRLIVLHLSTLAAAGALAGLLVLGILRASAGGLARRAAAGVLATLIVLLALLYVADAVTMSYWRHNATIDLVVRYLGRPQLLARYALSLAGWLPVAAGVVLVAAVIGFFIRSRALAGALRAVQTQPPAHARGLALWLAMVAVLGVVVASATVLTTPSELARRQLPVRDPIVGLFLETPRADAIGLAALAATYASEGPRVRAAYTPPAAFDRRNVILIVVDSLRADHMSLYGYPRRTTPFLERLRDEGRLRMVPHALATCPESSCGISSLLTSKTYASLLDEHFTVHQLLADRGYAVHFVLAGDHEWLRLRRFYGDVTTYFDGNRSARFEPTDDRVLFEGLDAIPPGDGRPAFFYFHLMSAHVLGIRQERHLVFQPSRAQTSYTLYGQDSPEMRVNNYDNGVRQADAIIADLFEALEARGQLRNSLVVITSDHGEGLGERPRNGFGHGWWLYEEFLRIPLLLYGADDVVSGDLDFATQIDAAPTIVDWLGLPAPASWEGRSLLRSATSPYSLHLLPGWPYEAVVYREEGRHWKLLRQDGREELYELVSDPGERRNRLRDADPALVRALRMHLENAVPERLERARRNAGK